MMCCSRLLLILIVSLISVAVSVENVLALCVHTASGEVSEGAELHSLMLLILMVLVTATIFYKKFIQPDTPAEELDLLSEPATCEWGPKHSAAHELKIGQNFSSWAKLKPMSPNGN